MLTFDIEVGCVWGRRVAEWKWAETIPGGKPTPSIDPSALFNCFTLCPCACEVMVMAIMMLALMIMRFMWNRKKVAITGVQRTIAIKLPCTFIHPASVVHPLYCATTVEPLLIGTLLKSLSFLPANQSRLHFHLLQPTLFLLFLLIVILKSFFRRKFSLTSQSSAFSQGSLNPD